MAEKYLKVMQDGSIVGFIPDNSQNRNFWARQNARLGKGGRTAAAEMVTLVPASDEEAEHMTKPVVESAKAVSNKPQAVSEVDQLREELRQQQALINKLFLNSNSIYENKEEGERNDGEETTSILEKKKPGPKPKNQENGETNKTASETE